MDDSLQHHGQRHVDASLGETLLIALADKLDGLEHFLVASPDVLPLHYDFCRPGPRNSQSAPRISPFSLSLSSFSGIAKNLGTCEAMKDSSGASSKKREMCRLHLEEPSDWELCAALWRNWPSIAPLKDADPELRHRINHRIWVSENIFLHETTGPCSWEDMCPDHGALQPLRPSCISAFLLCWSSLEDHGC